MCMCLCGAPCAHLQGTFVCSGQSCQSFLSIILPSILAQPQSLTDPSKLLLIPRSLLPDGTGLQTCVATSSSGDSNLGGFRLSCLHRKYNSPWSHPSLQPSLLFIQSCKLYIVLFCVLKATYTVSYHLTYIVTHNNAFQVIHDSKYKSCLFILIEEVCPLIFSKNQLPFCFSSLLVFVFHFFV